MLIDAREIKAEVSNRFEAGDAIGMPKDARDKLIDCIVEAVNAQLEKLAPVFSILDDGRRILSEYPEE